MFSRKSIIFLSSSQNDSLFRPTTYSVGKVLYESYWANRHRKWRFPLKKEQVISVTKETEQVMRYRDRRQLRSSSLRCLLLSLAVTPFAGYFFLFLRISFLLFWGVQLQLRRSTHSEIYPFSSNILSTIRITPGLFHTLIGDRKTIRTLSKFCPANKHIKSSSRV